MRVNGEVVTELGSRIDPETDLVDVDGTADAAGPTKRYVMLNKPTGVVSSMRDERGRPDLQPVHEGLRRAPLQRRPTRCRDQRPAHPHERRRPRAHAGAPVVRRDEDLHREGRGTVTAQTIATLTRGIELEDGPIAADKARLLSSSADGGELAGRAHPALGPQPHRAPDDGRGRAPGRRARAPAVRAAAPGTLPDGAARELTKVERASC